MSGITTLLKNPPPSCYLDGMALGDGIDAITGEISASALDRNFETISVPSSGTSETVSFRLVNDVTELAESSAFGFSSSITFPLDDAEISVKGAFDFTSSTESSVSVTFIFLDWERHGQSKKINHPKLNDTASAGLPNDPTFRQKYGDYFVDQISYTTKFTAIWYGFDNIVYTCTYLCVELGSAPLKSPLASKSSSKNFKFLGPFP